MSSPRRRLDVELVRRGLTATREQAQQEIENGHVTVAGAPALKASRLVALDEPLAVRRDRRRFVSRGGEKLDHALDYFTIDVDGRRALDAGASTGGFTDCLLQRGAREVMAVDVGRGQLHERLRIDPRVHVIDRTNVRHLTLAALPSGAPAEVVVADLSFISLRVVAAALIGLAVPDADLVLLVKPQFESGRAAVSKGRGVITDPALWREAILGVRAAFAPATTVSVVASSLLGAEGNAEFLTHVRLGDGHPDGHAFERELDAAIDTANDMRRKAATHAVAEGR